MEKLIQLLNEYEAERHKTSIVAEIWWQNGDKLTYLGLNSHYSELLCISKGYGFIQRLVEKDKIDRERILKENGQFRLFYYDLERVRNYDRLVMYLSVEDNPIGFLCSILV